MTSQWVLSDTGKCFRIKGNMFFEVVRNRLYLCNADIYHKEAGKYYAGYKNPLGRYTVYEKDGILNISREKRPDLGVPLYAVDLYEDIGGNYFPKLEGDNAAYHERKDGMVELVTYTGSGSAGRIEENRRDSFVNYTGQ